MISIHQGQSITTSNFVNQEKDLLITTQSFKQLQRHVVVFQLF